MVNHPLTHPSPIDVMVLKLDRSCNEAERARLTDDASRSVGDEKVCRSSSQEAWASQQQIRSRESQQSLIQVQMHVEFDQVMGLCFDDLVSSYTLLVNVFDAQ